MNEQRKYDVIKKLVDEGGNKKRAAITLGCTLRTVNRLICHYRKDGKASFSHGNKGRLPVTRISDTTRSAIVTLYENKYFDANLRHFTELLAEHESIHVSEATVRTILLEKMILSPKAHKNTCRKLKRLLQAQKAETTSKKEKDKLQEAIVTVSDPHPRRERCANAGELIQMDASPHKWFSDFTSSLHAAIDDATGILTGAYFDRQETLNGYYHVFSQILTNYGIPYMFYTDRRTVFEYKRKNSPDISEDTLTQFAYACKQLGVDIKTTSIAQAKGRVERLFETLQSRLPVEMRLAGVTTIEQANEFLNSYIPKFNAQFALPLKTSKSVFETQPPEDKINLYLSILTQRTVDAGHCIKFKKKYYRFLNSEGMYMDFHKGTKVMVIETFDAQLFVTVADRVFALEEVALHEARSRYFGNNVKDKAESRKVYIPDMNHPWRKDNFMKHVYAMLGKEQDWAC